LSGAAADWGAVISNGTAPFSVTWDFGGGAVENTLTQQAGAAATASATVQMLVGNWTASVSVVDAAGNTATASAAYTVEANGNPGGSGTTATFTPLPGTLYAVPLVANAEVGEPVTVEIVTGELETAMAQMTAIGVIVEADAEYVPDSFNAGAVGGAAYAADGIWQDEVADDQFLPIPDTFLRESALYGDVRRFDFNITPLGPSGEMDYPGFSGKAGVLCNFKLKFSTPGTKTLRFAPFNLLDRTYYLSDPLGGAPQHWSDITNDGSIARNAVAISAP
jgi:hypothetical protein